MITHGIWEAIHQYQVMQNLHSAVKPGVELNRLDPIMYQVDHIVYQTYRGLGYASIITSALDGRHSANSLHYKGRALDYRSRHVPAVTMQIIVRRLKLALDDCDVVLEETHLHVEYDPD